jgi:putative ABC transport system permease protein
MHEPIRDRRARWAVAGYRLLLLLFPRSFRREFGEAMTEDFRSLRDESMSGILGGLRTLSRESIDLVPAGLRERRAARQARRTAGPSGQKLGSAATIGGHMSALWTDIRYGVRMLFKSPLFSTIAILILALGIGANTAIFSIVDGILLRPLAYPDPDELVVLRTHFLGQEVFGLTEKQLVLFEDDGAELERIGGLISGFVTLGGSGAAERISVTWVTAGLFPALAVEPAIGRMFLPGELEPGADPVAILSHGLWRSRFGADPSVLGERIILNDQPATVVGVMPPGFHHPIDNLSTQRAALWLPNGFDRSNPSTGNHYLTAIARMAPDSDLDRVAAEGRLIMERIGEELPDVYRGATAEEIWIGPEPLRDAMVGEVQPALLVLLVAVAVVLLIACVNVANLLLVRGEARRREIAVRTAIGAGRAQIVRQLLIESALLAALGGAVGVLLANWGTRVLIALSPADLPRAQEVGIDARVLAFTSLVSVLAAVVFGMGPALQTSRLDVNRTLKQEGSGATQGRRRQILNRGLVVVEVSLAVVLVICAGLLVRSFAELRSTDPGFEANNLLTFRVSPPASAYPDSQDLQDFYDRLAAELEVLPGVVGVGAVNNAPLAGRAGDTIFEIEGKPTLSDMEFGAAMAGSRHSDFRCVSPGYFRTMGIPVARGREFTSSDEAGAPGVILINTTMAEKVWSGEDPIGQRMRLYTSPSSTGPWLEIVGIVGDSKILELGEEPRTEMFQPLRQVGNTWPWIVRDRTLIVRTSTDPMSVVGAARNVVAGIDDNLPIYAVQTMPDLVSANVAQPRFNSLLMGAFAAIALILATVGLYGVMSYGVAQRTQEIGVRLALGARPSDVLGLVIRQGMGLAAVGLGIGVVGALWASQALASMLYGVGTTDPLTYFVVVVFLAVVALLAIYITARRATRIDPKVALGQQ